MSRILIVDDEISICWAFREFLADEGHEVHIAASAEEGFEVADGGALDAVVLDIRLPGIDGLTALRGFRERVGPAPIILITAFGNLETVVRAMEGGAFDYLVKPFDLDHAGAVLKRALEKGKQRSRNGPEVAATAGLEALVGASPVMQDLFKRIALVAPTDVPVLITGESGTGKELVGRAIHRHSRRRDGPYLPICLAALNPSLVEGELFGHVRGSFTGAVQDRKGLLELANGGSVLLDEVGDIPLSLQVKLLRVIEHREFTPVGDARPRPTDIRVIAATNRPLPQLMATGQFREDLFFRLGVFQIQVPPLRDRREDIPALAEHFLRQSHPADDVDVRLSEDVLDELRARPWPGNIRELRNTIEHATIVARGRTIRPEHLPAAPTSPAAVSESTSTSASASGHDAIREHLAEWARREALKGSLQPAEGTLHERLLGLAEPPVLQAVLNLCLQNRAAAAQMLGIHRATLRQKLQKYGIE
jgi:two-component system nitrogen regulation response regulator GlnG